MAGKESKRKRKSLFFKGEKERHTAYIYRRKKLRKDRIKYVSEHKTLDVCPVFQEAFRLYKEGDLVASKLFTGYKVNSLLIDANMSNDPVAILPKAEERKNRNPTGGTYNLAKLEKKAWTKTRTKSKQCTRNGECLTG